MNVSRARLHTNKAAGTRGLTPILAYFNIVLACTIRTKSQRLCLFALMNFRNTLITFASTQSACPQTHFHCTNNRIMISFLRGRKLPFFSPEKGGVRINRVYALSDIHKGMCFSYVLKKKL